MTSSNLLLNALPYDAETQALLERAATEGMQVLQARDPYSVQLPQLVIDHDALEARVKRLEAHLSSINHDRRLV